jgi:hypothetical protein
MPDGADAREGAVSGLYVVVATHIVWTLIVWTLLLLVLVGSGEAAPHNVWLRVPLLILALGISALVVVATVLLFARYPTIGVGTLAFLAVTLVLALFLLRYTLGSGCGFCDDAASSVSNAPP